MKKIKFYSKNYVFVILSLVCMTMFLITGCSSNNDDDSFANVDEPSAIKTGKFIDGPIEGVSYKCGIVWIYQ
ncbi:membrane or secreted protein [Candidatus Magnetomorum sp. HK-1]|nr:membrane or secreted protein [Candidatus Magnetomorum sp. HK-1]